jgi:hypothetical protein
MFLPGNSKSLVVGGMTAPFWAANGKSMRDTVLHPA